MKTSKLLVSITLIIILMTEQLMAHSGHGHTEGHSLVHYLLEPVHAVVASTLLVGLLFLLMKYKSIRKQKSGKHA